MASQEWGNLRVPKQLLAELHEEAAALLKIHQEGRGSLPPEFCQFVPLHYVIARALEDMRAKRERSRAPRKGPNRKPVSS